MSLQTPTTQTELAYPMPIEYFYKWEKELADKVVYYQPINGQWHTWTYAQAAQEVRRIAAYLKANYGEGAKIAILSRNCAHWLMSDLAIMMAGCISVPIYPNVNAETVNFILEHSEAKAVFIGKLLAPDWETMRQGLPATEDTISIGKYDLYCDDKTWEEIVNETPALEGEPQGQLTDIWTIIYTSGTTGKPKGVVQTYYGAMFTITGYEEWVKFRESDRFFSYLPLSHVAERMLIAMTGMVYGCSVHFAESLDTFSDNLKTAKPTIFLAVPRIWVKFQMGVLQKFSQSRLNMLLSIPFLNNLIRKRVKEALGLENCRLPLTGAAPISKSTMNWWEKMGISIIEVYGMTENLTYSHSNRYTSRKVGTVGIPSPNVEVKLTEEGEICVKSPANMVEYYKEPEKTAATLKDGWLHTGDQGEIDSQGFLKITGRVKDLFKTSKAKYVAPNPIELKLAKNANIEQVMVVGSGIPQPLALVVPSEGARELEATELKASLEDTLKEVNTTLEHHEILQKIVIVKEEWTVENGAMTPSLKLKRSVIDKWYGEKYEDWYSGGKGVINA